MDAVKTAFYGAGGAMLPQPTDVEFQAFLEWSRGGPEPPSAAIDYARRCWGQFNQNPLDLRHDEARRIGQTIIGLDLEEGRQPARKMSDIDQKQIFVNLARCMCNHLAGRRGTKEQKPRWITGVWLFTIQLIIAHILGEAVGNPGKASALPWTTMNLEDGLIRRQTKDTISAHFAEPRSAPRRCMHSHAGSVPILSSKPLCRPRPEEAEGSQEGNPPKRQRLAESSISPTRVEAASGQSQGGSPVSSHQRLGSVVDNGTGESTTSAQRRDLVDGQAPQTSPEPPSGVHVVDPRHDVSHLAKEHPNSAFLKIKSLETKISEHAKARHEAEQVVAAQGEEARKCREQLMQERAGFSDKLRSEQARGQKRNDELEVMYFRSLKDEQNKRNLLSQANSNLQETIVQLKQTMAELGQTNRQLEEANLQHEQDKAMLTEKTRQLFAAHDNMSRARAEHDKHTEVFLSLGRAFATRTKQQACPDPKVDVRPETAHGRAAKGALVKKEPR